MKTCLFFIISFRVKLVFRDFVPKLKKNISEKLKTKKNLQALVQIEIMYKRRRKLQLKCSMFITKFAKFIIFFYANQ